MFMISETKAVSGPLILTIFGEVAFISLAARSFLEFALFEVLGFPGHLHVTGAPGHALS
jgi:hypothetical protein